jgi:hypothetical protein
MNQHVKLNRRAFVIGTAAAGAGALHSLSMFPSAAPPWRARPMVRPRSTPGS